MTNLAEMKLNLKNPIIFFDLKTTGVNIVNDRIVELCYIKVYPNGNEESKSMRINPEMHIPESSSVLKDEEDYQRIIDKLYHPIRDNFQTLANKTEQKQEAESIDNINPDATEKEATIVHQEEMPGNESGNESGEEPAKVLVEDNPSTTEDSREVPVETPIAKPKSWTLGGRIKNGLKKIAEDLDIITYNDENYK